MDDATARSTLEGLLEPLAAIEHQRWSRWQQYMHARGKVQEDGSLLIPPDLASRWARQMNTPYAGLSGAEKESDRDQVRQYLTFIIESLSETGSR